MGLLPKSVSAAKSGLGAMVSPQLYRGEAMMKRNIPNEDATCCLMASTHTARRYHGTQLQFQEKGFWASRPFFSHAFCSMFIVHP